MTLKTEGRRFVQELRRNRRARLLAHQTIASMDGGWWGGILQNRMRPVVLTAAARRGCLSTRVLPRDAARAFIAKRRGGYSVWVPPGSISTPSRPVSASVSRGGRSPLPAPGFSPRGARRQGPRLADRARSAGTGLKTIRIRWNCALV